MPAEYTAPREDIHIIAIDFDGCICAGGYPDIKQGTIIESTVEKIKQQMKDRPDTEFVLWTCRWGEQLNDAIGFCHSHQLPIHYFNEHHPRAKVWFGKNGLGPKIYAHEYWDDKAVTVKA